jgi:ketosteroid isomerase-like protein
MDLLAVESSVKFMVTGGVLLAAVIVDAIARRQRLPRAGSRPSNSTRWRIWFACWPRSSSQLSIRNTRRGMSGESSDVVRRQFEALARSFDAAAEFWHPDISWRAAEGAADDVGIMRGTQALRRYYEDWFELFDELHAEVEEVIFEGAERCAVVVRNSGRPRGSQAIAQGRYFVVCGVRDGRILSGREYETRGEALEAAKQHGVDIAAER